MGPVGAEVGLADGRSERDGIPVGEKVTVGAGDVVGDRDGFGSDGKDEGKVEGKKLGIAEIDGTVTREGCVEITEGRDDIDGASTSNEGGSDGRILGTEEVEGMVAWEGIVLIVGSVLGTEEVEGMVAWEGTRLTVGSTFAEGFSDCDGEELGA